MPSRLKKRSANRHVALMTEPSSNPDPSPAHVDVLIVGAGISGISMAAHMGMHCPDRSYAIVERREKLGGTWDLFRYPGVRSDSDMYTLGFDFAPWDEKEAIAGGDAILGYLGRVVDRHGIRPNIRFGTRVIAADFLSDQAQWQVEIEDATGRRQMTASFLYLASGYYDYDEPHEAGFEGTKEFRGTIAHPQFWPADLDHAGKRVVVIGSGATAVTIVPSMAATASHVTMLQRTPTWMGARPSRDRLANMVRAILPERLAYRLIRKRNVWMNDFVFKRSRAKPNKVGKFLSKQVRMALGSHYNERDWLPPYGPWDQRLCLVPDGDLFGAVASGKASVVTDHVDRFDETGIRLASGRHLDADIIVTATGLRLAIAGGIAVKLDGIRVNWRKHFYYRACMFSNLPNLAVVFGYLNASWTLRADATARYICDVLNLMRAKGAHRVEPHLPDDHGLEEDNVYDFSSGYLRRALPLMPKSAKSLPWRLNQDYRQDRRDFREKPADDGILKFETVRERTPSEQLAV